MNHIVSNPARFCRAALWAIALSTALALAGCGGGSSSNASSASAFAGVTGDFTKTVSVSGVTRTYLLHVPASYSGKAAAAVVLLLHGGNGSAATVSGVTGGFSDLADRSGFIAVYPDAVGGNWDDGRETITVHTNDVSFVAALLDALAVDYNVDTKRIYASGISNGGMMTHRLACDLSSRIAAVATVAANIPSAITALCSPAHAMPVVMFSGTADPLMPYTGGTVVSGVGGAVLSAPDTAAFWVQKNQVSTTPQTGTLADTDPTDGTTTDLFDYGGAASVGEVVLFRINNGGHTWPGGTQYLPALVVGKVSKDFSANDVMWAFFARHVLP